MKYIIVLYIASFTIFPIVNCNGMFDSIYENMKNTREALKEVASSINSGMKSLTKTIKFVEKFIDSTLEEDCEFHCKNKNEIPYPNPSHIPEVNGCGSLGLYLEMEDLPNSKMHDCCNEHDICYDTCGSDKEVCDKDFKRCLYKTCDVIKNDKINYRICQGGAKMLYTTTIALGCTSFIDSQGNACLCKDKNYRFNIPKDEF